MNSHKSLPPSHVTVAEVMEKGLNTELYWKNDDPAHTVSMVPTSAITGEGIPDLLLWLVRLTQVSVASLYFHCMRSDAIAAAILFRKCDDWIESFAAGARARVRALKKLFVSVVH